MFALDHSSTTHLDMYRLNGHILNGHRNQSTPVPPHNIPPLQPSCPQLAVGVRSQRAGRHTTQCGRWSGVHTVSHVTCESTPRLPLFFLSCRPVHVDLVGGLILLHGVAGRQNQSISRLPCRLQHLIEPFPMHQEPNHAADGFSQITKKVFLVHVVDAAAGKAADDVLLSSLASLV